MSNEHNDKSTHTEDKTPYSVEEILSEFSTSREDQRVVPFPTQPAQASDDETHSGDKKTAEIIDLPPDNLLFEIGEKVRGLLHRADEYADQMYQQAEPTPEELEAEQYIPGVDREEIPEESEPARPRRFRRKPPAPPRDLPAADLAARLRQGLGHIRPRLFFCLLFLLIAVWCSAGLPLPGLGLDDYMLRLVCSIAALALTTLLCIDVVAAGFVQLFTLHPGAETLCALCALITLADGSTMPVLGLRENTLPFAAPACAVLLSALWGRSIKRRADYQCCRIASQAKEPYLLTLDESKWSGRPAYAKHSAPPRGFGSQIQSPDGVQQIYSIAAPLLLLACVACALLASVGHGKPSQFLWAFSATLTAAASLSSLTAYALPYRRIVRRLGRSGSALAGWPGAEVCSHDSLILTDSDLFPTGMVKLNGIKIFGDFSNEKVISYTATLIRAAHSGLEKPFSDLVKSQNTMYRQATGIRFHEGGITGIIRNHEVIVGTSDFMHLMNITLPQGLRVKSAVFCAIGGELAGIFAIHYAMHEDASPCLSALIRNHISPLLATRDPNLLPSLLGQKFKLPVDRMEFPSVDRRLDLSDPEQEHSETITAVLLREGLLPYSDAAIGACRLRTAVRFGGATSVAGAALGVVLTFYLTFMDAYRSLSPMALLIFLLAWLLPTLLLGDWVDRY